MKLSIATVSLSGDLAEKLEADFRLDESHSAGFYGFISTAHSGHAGTCPGTPINGGGRPTLGPPRVGQGVQVGIAGRVIRLARRTQHAGNRGKQHKEIEWHVQRGHVEIPSPAHFRRHRPIELVERHLGHDSVGKYACRMYHAVERAEQPASLLLETALLSPSAHRVFVDCTANAELAAAYESLLQQGVAIVSANKIALSGSLEIYERLRTAARKGNGLFSETTVGAGLPVLRPIADLVATGDVVKRIDGVLSGTLSFLFAQIMKGVPFMKDWMTMRWRQAVGKPSGPVATWTAWWASGR